MPSGREIYDAIMRSRETFLARAIESSLSEEERDVLKKAPELLNC
jgi:DNA-binding MarR family transcriptional regulator